MEHFTSGTRSPFARAVSAEVRARMAAQRITGRELAAGAGFSSHNFLAIRLRDEKPFTLDDVALICAYFDEEPPQFLTRAYANHEERLWEDLLEQQRGSSEGAPTLRAVAKKGRREEPGEESI